MDIKILKNQQKKENLQRQEIHEQVTNINNCEKHQLNIPVIP